MQATMIPLALSLHSDDADVSSSSSPIVLPPVTSKGSSITSSSIMPLKKPDDDDELVAQANASPKSTQQPQQQQIQDSFDIVLPTSIGMKSGDCTVLVQIEPKDASLLELEGASGAIGRLEADDQELTLDLKGYQFSGHIFPGPSVMVLSLNNKAGVLKVEGITDEFVHMVQKRKRGLDAVVTGDTDGRFHRIGRDDDENDDDDDVWENQHNKQDHQNGKQKQGKSKVGSKQNQKKKGGGAKGGARKRKKISSSTTAKAKR